MSRARHARRSPLAVTAAVCTAVGGVLVPLALAAPAQAAERYTTASRISAPHGAVSPGRVPVSVRLVQGSSYVANAVVDVQILGGGGWRTVSRMPTDRRGLGHTALQVDRDTRVRAYYRGSSVRTPSASSSVLVDVADRGRNVLAEAARHRGAPYRYGATGPSAFDCSGFTRYVYAKFGRSLPHSARAQERVTTPVSKSSARPGDLVFIQGAGDHVGIFAGNGRMWDAPKPGASVSLRRIWTSNYTVGRV